MAKNQLGREVISSSSIIGITVAWHENEQEYEGLVVASAFNQRAERFELLINMGDFLKFRQKAAYDVRPV